MTVDVIHALVDKRGDYAGAVYGRDVRRLLKHQADLYGYEHLHIEDEPMRDDHSMSRFAIDDADATHEDLEGYE